MPEPEGGLAGRARGSRTKLSGEGARTAWRALQEGRWSVLESTERDGRCYLVVRPDTPLDGSRAELELGASESRARRPAPLSAQEKRVLIEFARGGSNKLIAYELGLATSTVGTLLSRAARKLGCESRVMLAHAGRDLARENALRPGPAAPHEPSQPSR